MSRSQEPLQPDAVVASFDSASVLHASTVEALEGRAFPHLGKPPILGAAVRAAGRLPWPVLRRIYARIGGAEGIDPCLVQVTSTWPVVRLGPTRCSRTAAAAG